MDENASLPEEPGRPDDEPTTVLELFGMKVKVRNPRLAEVLTTELGAAGPSTSAPIEDAAEMSTRRLEIEQAVPDVVLSPHTPAEEQRERARLELRTRVERAAEALGFAVRHDGVWESPTGVTLYTRTVDRLVTLAAAADIAEKVDALAREHSEGDPLSLIVVDAQETADVFRVAIRQRHAYDRMRTITVGNLEFLRSLQVAGVIDHAGAVVLLAPMAEIDVGELLSIVRAAGEAVGA